MDTPGLRPSPESLAPRYSLSRRVVAGLAWSAIARQPRSFVRDSLHAVERLDPPPEVAGGEFVPRTGPCLVACNHYSRPGFRAWWLTFAATAALAERRTLGTKEEMAWVITAAWRFEGHPWRQRLLTPLSRIVFARIAHTYGFVTMPPMPPAPEETRDRAVAVRRTLRLAQRLATTGGLLGLSPEGRDSAVGLAEPPPGVGAFIALLVDTGMPVLPVAIYEANGRLRIHFGCAFVPEVPMDRAARDRAVAAQVMEAIRSLMP